jgi:hypothetical protein
VAVYGLSVSPLLIDGLDSSSSTIAFSAGCGENRPEVAGARRPCIWHQEDQGFGPEEDWHRQGRPREISIDRWWCGACGAGVRWSSRNRQSRNVTTLRMDMNQKIEKPKEKIALKPPKNLPVKKDGLVKGGRYIEL